jgi:hypothetical protein
MKAQLNENGMSKSSINSSNLAYLATLWELVSVAEPISQMDLPHGHKTQATKACSCACLASTLKAPCQYESCYLSCNIPDKS